MEFASLVQWALQDISSAGLYQIILDSKPKAKDKEALRLRDVSVLRDCSTEILDCLFSFSYLYLFRRPPSLGGPPCRSTCAAAHPNQIHQLFKR